MKRDYNGFIVLNKKIKSKKSKKTMSHHELACDFDTKENDVPFFTEEDYDPAKFRVNIRKDFTIDRPKPKKKKSYQGATFEAGRTGFKLRIFFG